jgi:hypothetical protein
MANATADRILEMVGAPGREYELPVAASTTLYKGTMGAVLTATGDVVAATTASSEAAFGVILHGVDNSSGSSGDKRVRIETDCVSIQANDTTNPVSEANLIGCVLYAVDDHTVSDTQTASEPVAGYFAGLEPDSRVRVYHPLPANVSLGAVSVASTVATRTALKAIAAAARYEGQTVLVQSDNSLWTFEASNTGTTDTAEELLIEPTAGTGAWVRADKSFIMKIPISYANTDGEAIETIPAGFALRLAGFPYWEVTTGFTGGSSSAIGISTNISGYETGGDLLGGASGDVAATLVAGDIAGTLGGELDDNVGFQALLFIAASEFQFDRITSAFTAGAGFACVPVVQCAT